MIEIAEEDQICITCGRNIEIGEYCKRLFSTYECEICFENDCEELNNDRP